VEVYSIGFTKKTAGQFFGLLKSAGIRRLLDVRLNNASQLAGFSKRGDLEYFLREICGAEYRHEPLLAPTKDMLGDYRKRKGSWEVYEQRFLDLMADRNIENQLDYGGFCDADRSALQRANPRSLPPAARFGVSSAKMA
jgi:hypothetical protein